MAGPSWRNIYDLKDEQIRDLGEAEDLMELMQISEAESILLNLIDKSPNCVPILNVMGHMQGRYLSDFENAIGTIESTNFEPMATADQGFSLTDRFNAALVPPQITCAFTKNISSVTSSTVQQGFQISGTPGSSSFTIQLLAMNYTNTTGGVTSNMYEYFRFIRFITFYTTKQFICRY